jgi:ABC-type glutathione transport system ATPase component
MTSNGFICPVPGAILGETEVIGNSYVESSFGYSYDHLWRNIGILSGFLIFFTATYLAAAELNLSGSGQQGTIKFLRKDLPKISHSEGEADPSAERSAVQDLGDAYKSVQCLTSDKTVFSWRDAKYEIKSGDEVRRLLDNISGWVESGSLTALMGISGAGKTTLLDFLARRLRSGVPSGSITLSGKKISLGTIEKLGNKERCNCGSMADCTTGYVPQQDILFETATVREALHFSAILRQSRSTSKADKYRYVEDIIQARIPDQPKITYEKLIAFRSLACKILQAR